MNNISSVVAASKGMRYHTLVLFVFLMFTYRIQYVNGNHKKHTSIQVLADKKAFVLV